MNNISLYKVSICIPIYGVEKYIERCAISLFEQTYNNIEYIFVNDCTKDKSIDILQSVINRYPSRQSSIYIFHHTVNRGLAATRNTAISKCSGKFLMHVDSDDYIEKNTIQLSIEQQQLIDADIVSFGCYREYPNHTIVQNPPKFKSANEMCNILIQKNANVGVWGRLYRKDLYYENNITAKEGIDVAEDYQVSPLLAYYAKRITVIQQPLYHYNLNNTTSYMSNISELKLAQLFESYSIIKLFFSNKKDEYISSINIAGIKILSFITKKCIIARSKECYDKYRKELLSLSNSTYNKLNLRYKIFIKLNKYKLFNLYFYISNVFKIHK